MNVCGWHSKTVRPSVPPAPCAPETSFVRSSRAASAPPVFRPAKTRRCAASSAYSAPGFPNPTMRCKFSMRGNGGPAFPPAARTAKTISSSRAFFSPWLLGALARGGLFASPLAGGFRAPLAARFSPALAGRAPSVAFFLLLLDHLHVAARPGGFQRGGHFFFGAGAATATTEICLSPKISTPAGRLDVADVDGLADFQMGHVHDDLFRQILGQAAHLELEQDVFQRAAAVLDAGGFAGGFHRHLTVTFSFSATS
jgi:hypothetical protein